MGPSSAPINSSEETHSEARPRSVCANPSGRKLWKPTKQRRRLSLRSLSQQWHPLHRPLCRPLRLRPPFAAEDTQRRTVAVATWRHGQPIAAVDMCHHRLTVVVAMWRPPHTAADAMLHRPRTAADAMLHHPHTAADAMLHRPHTAADAMLHRPHTAAGAMLHRPRIAADATLHHPPQGSARRLQATGAAPPREACAVAAVAAALTVGVRVAAIPRAEAAKPGTAATMEGRVAARAQR